MTTKKKSSKKVKNNKKKRSKVGLVLKVLLLLIISVMAIVGIIFGPKALAMYSEAKKLVSESTYETFKATETSLVYDVEGTLMKTLKSDKEVYYLPIANIPDYAKDALVSIEDKRFYKHGGIDLRGIARAGVGYIKNKGSLVQGGGSTITQQLSRNIYLTNEVSTERKMKEIFISLELEKKYTKDEILEFYLNNIYFSNGYYGIQAASNGYFNKSINSLTLSQTALLCSIPNSPTAYNPRTNLDRALLRRDKILLNMKDDGVITADEYQKAIDEKIKIKEKKSGSSYNYVESYVYESATKSLMAVNGFKFRNIFNSETDKANYTEEYNLAYDYYQKSLYTEGYRIFTSIDLSKQEVLQQSVDDSLKEYQEKTEDGIYKMQGASVTIDNATGRVVAIVGGRSQENMSGRTLNRAYQSARQPGSSIKPLLVYGPAFDILNYSPSSMVDDTPPKKGEPKNAGSYSGRIQLRQAVEKSKNIVAHRVYKELTPQVGVTYLQKMKFGSLAAQDSNNLAMALGGFTHGASAVEMAAGYATLANDGKYREPTCIVKIMNTDGETIVSDAVKEEQVYSKNAARMTTDVLKGVLIRGTAAGRSVPNMDSAGKTGTTNSYKDAWFCGYTPYFTTAVWVGYDIPQSTSGLQGASFPLRIWSGFMNQVHADLERKNFAAYENPSNQTEGTWSGTTRRPATEAPTEASTDEVTTEEEATTQTEAPVATEAPTTEAPPQTEEPLMDPNLGDIEDIE